MNAFLYKTPFSSGCPELSRSDSFYITIVLFSGFKRKYWSKGPKGDIGPGGATGPRGPTGALGTKGQKGVSGTFGPKGTAGTKGAKGDMGVCDTKVFIIIFVF